MSLRASNGPAPAKRSAKVGERIAFSVKVENTSAEEHAVVLVVQDLKEGPLAKAVDFTFVFEPADQVARKKTRTVLVYDWTAALPEGKTAFTFRGKMLLMKEGEVVAFASAPLDLYVSS